MESTSSRPGRSTRPCRKLLALVCVALLAHGEVALLAQEAPQGMPAEPAAAKLPPDQLDSLVAPIALYPDPLLAQTLVAATYPLELIQLQQWLAKNSTLKDKALADAVAKQPWDPSIQSMAAIPEVVKRLADDIQWTTQLGDAFLDQQSEVMDAVQRMRKKAEEKGALKSNEQQIVETKVIEQKTVIVVQPSNPEVIYVPSYNPMVVYPPPIYPYPPVYYPPYPAGAALVSFGVGMAVGAAVWGGSCCHAGWGGNNTVNVNVNNNFNKNTNVSAGNVQHNSQHRGGAPYSSQATANKYGGSAQGGGGSRGTSSGASTRSAGASSASRGGGAGASASTSSRGGGASASSSSRGGGGGGGSKSGAFGGGSDGFSGSSAKASSSRGSSSMSSRGGGGGSRGGGGGRRR
jgi:hypothetical protein